jgi:hypothetical protein
MTILGAALRTGRSRRLESSGVKSMDKQGSLVLLRSLASLAVDRITYGRASRIMLNGVSAARRTRVKPPFDRTSLKRRSPACAPKARPTS